MDKDKQLKSYTTRSSMDLIEGITQHYPQGLQKPELDAHIQRQRWDAFFDPQYSFGAFVHNLSQEEQEEYEKYHHQRKLDRLIDDGNYHIKSPPLRESSDRISTITETSTAVVSPTLPNLSSEPNNNRACWGPKDENALIERLELLKKMRAQPILASSKTTTTQDPSEEAGGHAARWKRHISEKAKQLRKEATDDTSSTHSSMDPDEKQVDEESGAVTTTTTTKKYGCRRSFLCFLFGFLFPPLWLFGAFYCSGYADQQTSASRRIDRVWRRRSRIAFGIFTIILMIILVIVFVLNPQSIGWRQSKEMTENYL
ncbi:hypothetical protein BD770DRAFT_407851 [Pilaira anomala]|nr:hypothetical protein BD770DRAFT_407851 [Pilaira anomala]